jgi:hypothetical protein
LPSCSAGACAFPAENRISEGGSFFPRKATRRPHGLEYPVALVVLLELGGHAPHAVWALHANCDRGGSADHADRRNHRQFGRRRQQQKEQRHTQNKDGHHGEELFHDPRRFHEPA